MRVLVREQALHDRLCEAFKKLGFKLKDPRNLVSAESLDGAA